MHILPIIYICAAILFLTVTYLHWRRADEKIRKKIKKFIIVECVLGISLIVLCIIWLIILYG